MLAKFHQWTTISPAPNLPSDPLFHPKKYNIYTHIYVYICVCFYFCTIYNLNTHLYETGWINHGLSNEWNIMLFTEKERWFLHIAKSHLFSGWVKGRGKLRLFLLIWRPGMKIHEYTTYLPVLFTFTRMTKSKIKLVTYIDQKEGKQRRDIELLWIYLFCRFVFETILYTMIKQIKLSIKSNSGSSF